MQLYVANMPSSMLFTGKALSYIRTQAKNIRN